MSHAQPPGGRAAPPRASFREALWEYLGHPADETPERRRILYAIVILRLGLGLMFLLRGWSAIFATPPDAFAVRLGDPARWGLGGLATDTTLFILGCTELGVGLLLIFGAFTRVSAVTGMLLLSLAFAFGQFRPDLACTDVCSDSPLRGFFRNWRDHAALLMMIGGLVPIIVCGSPFLSADRALDKLEEEERDRAPATLPRVAVATPLALRLGFAAALIFVGLHWLVLGRSWLFFGMAAAPAIPLLLGIGGRAGVVPAGCLVVVAAVEEIARGITLNTAGLVLAIVAVLGALLTTGAGRLGNVRGQDSVGDATDSIASPVRR
jgi:uncharacterized membrane protein YphA (DoxX/SURF4 family)